MTNEEAKVFLDNLKICIDEHPIVADWLVEIENRNDEPSNSEKPNNSTISKMEQVDEPQIDNLATAIANEAYCKTCKHLLDEDCDCDVVFTGYEPKDEPQTERSFE